MTLGEALAEAALKRPDDEALIDVENGTHYTWSELNSASDRIASGLVALGLAPGDRVGLCAPNSARWVIIQFALAKAGLILVSLNPAYRATELAFALRRTGCATLIVAHRFKTTDYEALVDQVRELLRLQNETSPQHHLDHVIALDDTSFPGAIPYARLDQGPTGDSYGSKGQTLPAVKAGDAVNIQFTSGTTGTPKAATLSHRSVLNNARFCGLNMGLSPNDRLCVPVPMYHCFGMVLGTLTCLTSGAAMIIPSAGFDPGATLNAIESLSCTAIHGVPTMFLLELEHPSFPQRRLSSLRTGIIAGAPCPVSLMRKLIEQMHLTEITIAYGMTETGPVSFQTARDDTLERRVGTVGRVLPHTEAKIVDATGETIPVGEPGEFLCRGYGTMMGYWGDPEKTAEAIDRDGWMRSGDLAQFDKDGYCRIVGRIKDMLIRGGENIFPTEIESCLYSHPSVEQAEVFGVPDSKYGEAVCAWVRVRDGTVVTENDLRSFLKERLAHFKIPEYIQFVDSFPTTASGKVQKYKMRETMTSRLELNPPEAST